MSDDHGSQPPEQRAQSGYVGRPMEILLIEDSQIDARFTILSLRGLPFRHRLTLVRDGADGSSFLRREGVYATAPMPDVVLLDLVLPKISGLCLLRGIRAIPNIAKLPVIVLTASENIADQLECRELNVEHFIHKPVNVEKFQRVIDNLKQLWHHEIIFPAREK
jgi:two-component system response regulator